MQRIRKYTVNNKLVLIYSLHSTTDAELYGKVTGEPITSDRAWLKVHRKQLTMSPSNISEELAKN